MSDPWFQLILEAVHHSPQRLEEALLEAGALAVTLQDAGDDPVLEPAPGETPLWTRTRVSGLFDSCSDLRVLQQCLHQALGDATLATCRVEGLAERDWARTWLDEFRPMRFGKRLWVCPGGQPPPDPDAAILWLDPGLAFGTGTHPSTALCLEWLEAADLTGTTVIDYGCGSGILAIAALKLGARQVWAVDIDPQALAAAAANAAANGVRHCMHVVPPEGLVNPQAERLIANILAGPLIDLAARFAGLVRVRGRLVLSGILAHQADALEEAFSPWFEFAPRRQREEWILLQALRRG